MAAVREVEMAHVGAAAGPGLFQLLRRFYDSFMSKTHRYPNYSYETFLAEFRTMSTVMLLYYVGMGAATWRESAWDNTRGARVELGGRGATEAHLSPEELRQRMWWRKTIANIGVILREFGLYQHLEALPADRRGLGELDRAARPPPVIRARLARRASNPCRSKPGALRWPAPPLHHRMNRPSGRGVPRHRTPDVRWLRSKISGSVRGPQPAPTGSAPPVSIRTRTPRHEQFTRSRMLPTVTWGRNRRLSDAGGPNCARRSCRGGSATAHVQRQHGATIRACRRSR